MLKEPISKTSALDSCIGRRIYENAEYFDMVKMKVPGLSNSTIVFTTVSEYEINKRTEYGFDKMHSQLESSLDSDIAIEQISSDMRQLGIWLCDNIEGLHHPDNQILAHAMITDSVLITCDKSLEKAAVLAGQDVINPDQVIIDRRIRKTDFSKFVQKKVNQLKNVNPDIMTFNVDTRRSKTPYFATVKKVIQEKKKQITHNASIILKSGQKIIWSLTT